MLTLRLILTILSLICLFCAAVGVNAPRVSLGWLGLFFWLLSVVVLTN